MITSLNLYKDKITKLESLLPGISNNFRFYLKKALNYSDSSIILSDDIYVSDQEASLIEEFINLSKKQVPIEYILNDSEFYGRNFYVDNRVLIPRDETELIIDILLDQDIKNTSKIIDLGTGSGCLGISIALELPESSVLGVDKYLDAIDVAIKNKDIHKVSNFNVKQSDWFSNVNEENFELNSEEENIFKNMEGKDFEYTHKELFPNLYEEYKAQTNENREVIKEESAESETYKNVGITHENKESEKI